MLLLAIVIEARLFRYAETDAAFGVKEARAELRKSYPGVIYALLWARSMYRRTGISTILNFVIAVGLVGSEMVGLYVMSKDWPLDTSGQVSFIFIITVATVLVALKPVFDKIVRQNVQLAAMEQRIAQRYREPEKKRRRSGNPTKD